MLYSSQSLVSLPVIHSMPSLVYDTALHVMSLLLLHTKVASSAAPAHTATAASPHTMHAPE